MDQVRTGPVLQLVGNAGGGGMFSLCPAYLWPEGAVRQPESGVDHVDLGPGPIWYVRARFMSGHSARAAAMAAAPGARCIPSCGCGRCRDR